MSQTILLKNILKNADLFPLKIYNHPKIQKCIHYTFLYKNAGLFQPKFGSNMDKAAGLNLVIKWLGCSIFDPNLV